MGIVNCKAKVEEFFPLLCPKREEEWIPGWECETVWSHSGCNEAWQLNSPLALAKDTAQRACLGDICSAVLKGEPD